MANLPKPTGHLSPLDSITLRQALLRATALRQAGDESTGNMLAILVQLYQQQSQELARLREQLREARDG